MTCQSGGNIFKMVVVATAVFAPIDAEGQQTISRLIDVHEAANPVLIPKGESLLGGPADAPHSDLPRLSDRLVERTSCNGTSKLVPLDTDLTSTPSDDPLSLSYDVRLSELLASNRTGIRDDEGDSSDWLEIHNASDAPLRLDGYSLTDDTEVLDKWKFPHRRLPANGYFLVWMSGKDRTGLAPSALLASTMPFESTLIPPHAENWKYVFRVSTADSENGNGVSQDWSSVDFDDSSFTIGQAGFGYGDDDDRTVLPAGTTAVLARYEFTLENDPESNSLVLDVDYDDGFVAYLNGVRIATRNFDVRQGAPNLNSIASGTHDAGIPERIDVSAHAGLLRQGKNVLAVAGLNSSPKSSDLSLNPALGILPAVCHAAFTLKKKGGVLYLVNPAGQIVDKVDYGKQQTDQSFGRSSRAAVSDALDRNDPPTPAGDLPRKDAWGYFLVPTPGAPNTSPKHPTPVKSRVSFLPGPAAFDESVEVHLKSDSNREVTLRFTMDGSEPTSASSQYQKPIRIIETTLFRAAAFLGEERSSRIESATYLVGPRPDLPVFSISLKPAHFQEVHLNSSATGPNSERPAFLEVFTATGERVEATGLGFRLHGGASRRGNLQRKKSYRLYFRREHGIGRLDYPIISDAGIKNFDKLVLRANANDRAPHGSNIRDQIIRDLHTDMGALAASGSWCMLLINNEHRGLFNVTERMDADFLESHLGPGEFDVVKTGETVLEGSRDDFDDLKRFVTTTDFSQQGNFDRLAQRVDIENFTSYVILNLCLTNFDWPHNNWYAARKVPDGKWIFMCWDAEWALGYEFPILHGAPYGVDVNPYAFMDCGGSGNGLTRMLFMGLLENPGYRKYYQDEVRRHLSDALSPENIAKHVERQRDLIESGIEAEFRVRNDDQRIKEQWLKQIAQVDHFGRESPGWFQKYTDEYFAHRGEPDGEDRVTIHEVENGTRYIVYRDADGRLRELISPADRSSQHDQLISVPDAPRATGPPVMEQSAGIRYVIYRGTDAHLHAVSKALVATDTVSGSATSKWTHTDLTTRLSLPTVSGDPSVVVANDVLHIVYVDQAGHPRELWHDETWHHFPLPVGPRPAGDVLTSHSGSMLRVTFRTMYGVPCEHTLNLDSATSEQRVWFTRLVQRVPAAGQPIGFDVDGRRQFVFRTPEEWPREQPFIFTYNARRNPGYKDYEGGTDVVVHAWDAGRQFHRLDQLGRPKTPVAGSPSLVVDASMGRHYVAWRDALGHLHETTVPETLPAREPAPVTDLTLETKSPLAVSDPVGVISLQGQRSYLYWDAAGNLQELLRHPNGWIHRALPASRNHPIPGR